MSARFSDIRFQPLQIEASVRFFHRARTQSRPKVMKEFWSTPIAVGER
jgi:hypothetical protein